MPASKSRVPEPKSCRCALGDTARAKFWLNLSRRKTCAPRSSRPRAMDIRTPSTRSGPRLGDTRVRLSSRSVLRGRVYNKC
jgi:hypothetical protein